MPQPLLDPSEARATQSGGVSELHWNSNKGEYELWPKGQHYINGPFKITVSGSKKTVEASGERHPDPTDGSEPEPPFGESDNPMWFTAEDFNCMGHLDGYYHFMTTPGGEVTVKVEAPHGQDTYIIETEGGIGALLSSCFCPCLASLKMKKMTLSRKITLRSLVSKVHTGRGTYSLHCYELWTVTKLDLDNKDLQEDGAAIAYVLQESATLETLILSQCTLSDTGVKYIAEALPFSASLTELNISGIRPYSDISDEGWKAFAKGLGCSASLKMLNLSDNMFGDEAAAAIATALPKVPLTHLDLGSIRVRKTETPAALETCTAVATATAVATPVVSVTAEPLPPELPVAVTETPAAVVPGTAVAAAGSLPPELPVALPVETGERGVPAESLYVPPVLPAAVVPAPAELNYTDEVWKAFAAQIPFMASLTSINVLRNQFSSEVAHTLCTIYKEHVTLKTLCGFTNGQTEADYSFGGLRDADAMLISADLTEGRFSASLSVLDLQDNAVGPEGARHLAEGIKLSASLEELYLHCNPIGDEGKEHLAKGISKSASLKHIMGVDLNKYLDILGLGPDHADSDNETILEAFHAHQGK